MNLKGKKVTLRAIEEEDLEMLRGIVNDPEIEGLVCGWSYPISKYNQRKWFEKISEDKDNIRFTIETEEDGAIGFAGIMDINWKNRTCFPGLKLANKELKTKGIGYDAMMVIMKYVFEELQLNHIEGKIIDYNERSKKLFFEKLGWKQEGIKRKYIFNRGAYHDLIICSILVEEYHELIQKTRYWSE
jgi:RimJ/RimL family protein N-acetyltransferase